IQGSPDTADVARHAAWKLVGHEKGVYPRSSFLGRQYTGLSVLSLLDVAGHVGRDGRQTFEESAMYKVSLFVRLEAKPGKENEVAKFLEAGLAMAQQETTTPLWFALRLGPTTFGVFDAFADESGRQTHLNGPIAKALLAKAPELLAKAPVIEPIEVLGSKQPG